MLRWLQRLWGYGVTSLLISFFVFFIKGYEVTKVTGVTGVTLAIKGSFPHQIQGYRVTSLLNFFPKYFFIKGYEVTKVTRVTGVTTALNQGVLSSSNLRLRGYRVTNWMIFFFKFLEKRVTRFPGLPGLQGLRWPCIKGSSPHQI